MGHGMSQEAGPKWSMTIHDRDAGSFRICHETMFVTKKSTGLVSLVRKRTINRISLPNFFSEFCNLYSFHYE